MGIKSILSCFSSDPQKQFLKQVNMIKEQLKIDQRIELSELSAKQKLLIVYNVMSDEKTKRLFSAALEKCASFQSDNTTNKSEFKDFVEAVFNVKENRKVSVFELNQLVSRPDIKTTKDVSEIKRFIAGGGEFVLGNNAVTEANLNGLMMSRNPAIELIVAPTNLLSLGEDPNLMLSQAPTNNEKPKIEVTTYELNQDFNANASVNNIKLVNLNNISASKKSACPFDAIINIHVVGGEEQYFKEIKLFLNDYHIVDSLRRVLSIDAHNNSEHTRSTHSSSGSLGPN